MLQTSFDNVKCAVHVPDTGEFSRRMTLTERKTLQAQNKTDKKKNPLPNFTSALSPFLKHYHSWLPGFIFTSAHKDEKANGGTTEGAQRCAFGGFGSGHPGESLGDNRRRYTNVEETVGAVCPL